MGHDSRGATTQNIVILGLIYFFGFHGWSSTISAATEFLPSEGTVTFAKTLNNSQHSTHLTTKSQRYNRLQFLESENYNYDKNVDKCLNKMFAKGLIKQRCSHEFPT